MEAYDAGNSELFDRILKSPRFPRIPDMALAYVYGNALQRNDLPFLTALICSPKAGPITHYIGETLATTNDPWLRETILESKIFPQIPADYIGNAAVVAASRGNTKTYLRLAKSNQFAGISIEQIGNILVNATFVNTLEIANHIMKDLRIDFIPVNDLEEALNNGLRFENRPMIHLLLTHSSIREIENELLEEAGKFISKIKI